MRVSHPGKFPIPYTLFMAIKTVLKSGNRKIGTMAATYRMVGQTCPSSCPLLVQGCYAKGGPVGIHQLKSGHSEADGAILLEFIGKLPVGEILRHHVSGDMFYGDEPDAVYIAGMNAAHDTRPDVKGYTYTHGWRKLDPKSFARTLAVNASCDTWDEVAQAQAAGWATVTVIPEDETRRRFKQPAHLDGEMVMLDVVVCPNQTVDLKCKDCKLCMKADRPFVVAFKAHGSAKRIVSERVR